MISRSLTRYVAVALVLLFLFWVGHVMVLAGHHLLAHGQRSDHAAQHSSLVCAWMCMSSSFIESPVQSLHQTALPVFYALALLSSFLLLQRPISSLNARAPPT